MIDFTRANLTHLIVHFVGNKGLGEELTFTSECVQFKDDFSKEILLQYLIGHFKTDVYHEFKKSIVTNISSVSSVCQDLFLSRASFIHNSHAIAVQLYNQTMHPKIKGGELYVVYFKDVICDGELVDSIGIFKTENKETFLKICSDGNRFDVDCEVGINPKKLDKGCLIFNTDKTTGYKLSIVDTNNKVAECALYWNEDFLNSTIKANSYYHTKNFIDAAVGFCEEILTEANNVDKAAQAQVLNQSVGYFKDRENFNLEEFEKEVLKQSELIDAFDDYRNAYAKRLDLTTVDDFEVSQTAVKKNQKYMRTVIKLDKNFHLYIHGRHDYLEKGYDEEKGLKYYKVYFVNEE